MSKIEEGLGTQGYISITSWWLLAAVSPSLRSRTRLKPLQLKGQCACRGRLRTFAKPLHNSRVRNNQRSPEQTDKLDCLPYKSSTHGRLQRWRLKYYSLRFGSARIIDPIRLYSWTFSIRRYILRAGHVLALRLQLASTSTKHCLVVIQTSCLN